MKNYVFTMAIMVVLVLIGCKEAATEPEVAVQETEKPDYETFAKKVAILKDYFQAHQNEDLEKMKSMVSDTLKWSPPHFNGNEFESKEALMTQIKLYHDNFDNITYEEGLGLDGQAGTANGHWAGSVFPEETASIAPDAIRIYGTWRATHTESGKNIGVKYYAIGWINDAGKIAQFTEYFDVNGIAVQLAAE